MPQRDSASPDRDPQRARLRRSFLWLAATLGVSFVISLYLGRGGSVDASLAAEFFRLRAHRSAVAVLAGAGLAVAGVVVQGLFRNPLASPSILGTTAGAALGGESALVFLHWSLGGHALLGLPAEVWTPFGCIAGAVIALAIVLVLTPLRASPVALLLTGFLLAALFSSLSSLLKISIQESWQLSRALNAFSLGSVSGVGPRQLALAALLIGGSALPVWSWSAELDLLLSGEDEAAALGVDVLRVRVWSVVWTAFMVAAAVAVGANVAFVGVIVPHVLRRWFGQTHRVLLPAAFLGGGVFLLWCDMLCRVLPFANEVPLSVVTALIGAPLFLRMLARLEGGAWS